MGSCKQTSPIQLFFHPLYAATAATRSLQSPSQPPFLRFNCRERTLSHTRDLSPSDVLSLFFFFLCARRRRAADRSSSATAVRQDRERQWQAEAATAAAASLTLLPKKRRLQLNCAVALIMEPLRETSSCSETGSSKYIHLPFAARYSVFTGTGNIIPPSWSYWARLQGTLPPLLQVKRRYTTFHVLVRQGRLQTKTSLSAVVPLSIFFRAITMNILQHQLDRIATFLSLYNDVLGTSKIDRCRGGGSEEALIT